MKWRISAIIFLLIGAGSLIPSVESSFTDVRTWIAFSLSFTDADGVVAATNFALNAIPHSFTVASRTTQVKWSGQFTTSPASAGTTDAYVVALTFKEGSTTRMTCTGASFSRAALPDIGRIQSTFVSFCQSTGSNAINPGTTYTYQTDVTMTTGTNHITDAVYSFEATEVDSVTDSTLDGLATGSSQVYQNTLINQTKQAVIDRSTYTNSIVNSTSSTILVRINDRSGYTNALINSTGVAILQRVNDRTTYSNALLNQTKTDLQSYINSKTAYSNALINSSFAAQDVDEDAEHAYANSLLNQSILQVRNWVSYSNNLQNLTHAHVDAHFAYTNSLINGTRSQQSYQNTIANSTRANLVSARVDLNETEQHADDILSQQAYQNGLANASFSKTWSRQSYTNGLINATSMGLNFTLGNLIVAIDHNVTQINNTINAFDFGNQTVTLLSNELGLQIGDTSILAILLILVMVALGTWLWLKKKDYLLRVVGGFVVFFAGFIALLIATKWSGGPIFASVILLYSIGLFLVLVLEGQRSRKRKNDKLEM